MHKVEPKYPLHLAAPLLNFLYSDQWAHVKYLIILVVHMALSYPSATRPCKLIIAPTKHLYVKVRIHTC